MGWCVYMLRCADGSLYTGATNDFAGRLARHVAGKGARYTRGRGPLEPVYLEPCEDRSDALRREHALKRLPVAGKRALAAGPVRPSPPSRAVVPGAPAPSARRSSGPG